MLRCIEFKDERFKKENEYNIFGELTENTIVLCNNQKIMGTLVDEIVNTVNGQAEYNDYWCDEEDVGQAKYDLREFGLQRIIIINNQKITLSIEPSIIYKADKPEDVWLFDWKGSDDNSVVPYQEFIYPMLMFKGSRKLWEDNRDNTYKAIVAGRYGCYDGKCFDNRLEIGKIR